MGRRHGWSTLLAAALVAASLGIGGWKVHLVRQENARLALEARACRSQNEAFLAMIRAAGAGEPRAVPAPAGR